MNNLLYILNGLGFSRGMPIGGADKRALEVGRYLQSQGWGVTVLTTDAGREVLEKWGWSPVFHTVKRPFFWPKFLENNLLGRVLSYFYAIFADLLSSLPFPTSNFQLLTSNFQLIYPTSDMFFDLLPAIFLKLKNRQAKLVGIAHHWIPSLWQRRGGNPLSDGLIFLAQRFGFLLLRFWADLILVPATAEGLRLKEVLVRAGVRKEKIGKFHNGVDLELIRSVPDQPKKFASCFLGGLRPSKGIFDLVPIWRMVVQKKPEARLLVIGGGVEKYEEDLKSKILNLKLENKIVLAGVVAQEELFHLVKSCRIFLAPSREEGWGMAVGEALACGLPAVVYDLPAYGSFAEAIVRVPRGRTELFAEEVIALLSDEKRYQNLRGEGLKVAENFGWEKAAEYESLLFRNHFGL